MPPNQIWQTKDTFSKGQGKGAANSGPENITELGNVLQSIPSQGIFSQTKIDIMQQAVAKCPKVSISRKGVQISSLLDSGSEVSLICQSYFKEHLLPRIETPAGEKADAHILFNLTVANDGQLPMKNYINLDINFLGLKVPNVGSLILEEPNRVLDRKHQTKLQGIIGWNLICLTHKVFIEKYGGEKFNSFEYLAGVNPLLSSQMCLYHYAEVSKDHDYVMQSIYHQTVKDIKSNPSKLAHLAKNKVQSFFLRKDGLKGKVTIGSKQQPICIPGHSTITIPGYTNKLPPRITCLMEQAEHHNLPLGIVINWCMAIPKARTISVIIITQTDIMYG